MLYAASYVPIMQEIVPPAVFGIVALLVRVAWLMLQS